MFQLLSQCLHVIFEVVSLSLILQVCISRTNITLSLLKYPDFVKPNYSSLELFEVLFLGEERLIDIILELSLLTFLISNDSLHLTRCLRQTLLPHPQVIYNQH